MEEQHLFRPHCSTVTDKTVFCNYVFDAFAVHSQVDIIYTDYDKAFDRVDHCALTHVLLESGIAGEPLMS